MRAGRLHCAAVAACHLLSAAACVHLTPLPAMTTLLPGRDLAAGHLLGAGAARGAWRRGAHRVAARHLLVPAGVTAAAADGTGEAGRRRVWPADRHAAQGNDVPHAQGEVLLPCATPLGPLAHPTLPSVHYHTPCTQDDAWLASYERWSSYNAELVSAAAQDPLRYRSLAVAAASLAARPHDHGVDAEQAAALCAKLM